MSRVEDTSLPVNKGNFLGYVFIDHTKGILFIKRSMIFYKPLPLMFDDSRLFAYTSICQDISSQTASHDK